MPESTPAASSFFTRMSELRHAPMPRKMASKPCCLRLDTVKSLPSVRLVRSFGPRPRIWATSRSRTSLGSRYSGIP